MVNPMQAIVARKLIESQMRPDQVVWLNKHKDLPQEVMLQFFLSPEGAKVIQLSFDALMKEADKVLAKVEELKAKK